MNIKIPVVQLVPSKTIELRNKVHETYFYVWRSTLTVILDVG